MMRVTRTEAPNDPGSDTFNAVKAALLAAGSFATAVITLLAVAGEWGTPDETVRFAIKWAGAITALAMGIAAVYVWPKK